MKGDFTRVTFDPAKYYSRVLMQQGRVQLDADWNEQSAILLHYLRALTRDVVGPYAGPADDCGFEIITSQTISRLVIVTDPKRRSYLESQVKKGNFVIGPGRYYVAGIPIENKRAILYTEQPGYPFSDSPTLEDIQGGLATLIYVDVWERHITYVEDDHIREVALEGPDTCTRAQVVWQVKVLTDTKIPGKAPSRIDCHSADALPRLGTGMLRARARLDKPPTELCSIPPSSRYRGAENQLYRVEIHHRGSAGNGATYKFSRENGSATYPIRKLSGTTATLETLGRDDHLSLKPDDWVEIIDDQIVLSGRPGWLAQVKEVDRDDTTVTLSVPGTPPPAIRSYGADDAWLHPLLRRWDQMGDPAYAGALPVVEGAGPGSSGGWKSLEDGVQIRFSPGGQYRTGDHWLIPARVATGDVEWPHEVDDTSHKVVLDADGNPVPQAELAAGIYHSYAPLWLMNPVGAGYASGHDCRCQISPLPCVNYGYAHGATAIGQDLVSTAPKPEKASRGKKK
jgi:hypothetical protein